MSIDYQDLVKMKHELDQKIAEREEELRTQAFKLIEDYIASLNYDGESQSPLAFIGDANEEEVIAFKSSDLKLATNYHLKFKVFTDLNVDGDTRDYIIVGIDFHKSGDMLKVMVGGGQSHSSVHATQKEGHYDFEEVCSKIKQRVAKLVEKALPA
jgi:hypothetical protein